MPKLGDFKQYLIGTYINYTFSGLITIFAWNTRNNERKSNNWFIQKEETQWVKVDLSRAFVLVFFIFCTRKIKFKLLLFE